MSVPAPLSAMPPDDAGTESEWVARIRDSNERAFQALFLAYYRPLASFVFGYVRSRAIAEEIVQELLMNIWKQRESWYVRGTLKTYLFGAARNHALNHMRRLRLAEREVAHAEANEESLAMGQRPALLEDRVMREELWKAIARAEANLPGRQRQAFALRWRGQLSHAEIAQIMGISVKAVETNLGRAFRALREQLAPYV